MKRHFHLCTARVALICALVISGFTAGVAAKESPPPKLNLSDRPVDRTVRGVSYADVIKKAAPSVVNIYSTRTIHLQPFLHPFFNDPLFRRFFGPGYGGRGQRPRDQKSESLGSGVIVSKDGYILTNNHVVEGADKDGVQVALAGGKDKYTAKVVATDPQTDLAVLKIAASDLPAVTIADSDKLEVGDVVLAIGNPFGVGQSVTMGIVSAVGRGLGILGDTGYEDFIQTDAAINPGNSGGALVDAEGRLIGINQSIVSNGAGANAGVGFAVPSNLARDVMDRLVTEGKVERGYLGVYIQTVTPDLAKAFNLSDENGAIVSEVQPDTPAANAGLKNGDVITEFNGKKVTDSRHLRLMVAEARPKSRATLTIVRDGRVKNVTVTLGELPSNQGGNNDNGNQSDVSKSDALDGVEVTDLDTQARQQFSIPSHVRGALVTKVDPDSTAADAGLREGDVVMEINRQPVHDADEAVKLSDKAHGDHVLLRVWSNSGQGGGAHYLSVENKKK